jgi:putative NADPH-quinone reductase
VRRSLRNAGRLRGRVVLVAVTAGAFREAAEDDDEAEGRTFAPLRTAALAGFDTDGRTCTSD